MDFILSILDRPFFLTFLTLIIGGYLFSLLTERRAKRDQKREKALHFLDEMEKDLNQTLSLTFGRIRTRNYEISSNSRINRQRAALFEKRFGVRIKSKAFLDSETFWQKYEILTFELDKIILFIGSLGLNYNLDETTAKVSSYQKRLTEK